MMRNCLFILIIILLVVGVSAFGAWLVMLLWNFVMPDIFNLPELTFWKAFGLCVLIELFFKLINSGKNNEL